MEQGWGWERVKMMLWVAVLQTRLITLGMRTRQNPRMQLVHWKVLGMEVEVGCTAISHRCNKQVLGLVLVLVVLVLISLRGIWR
jgi:hypothetical protein